MSYKISYTAKLLLLPLLIVLGLSLFSNAAFAGSYAYEKQRQCTNAELKAFRLVLGDRWSMSEYRCRRIYSKHRSTSGKVQTCWWTQVRERRHPDPVDAFIFGEWTDWGTIGGGRPRGCR